MSDESTLVRLQKTLEQLWLSAPHHACSADTALTYLAGQDCDVVFLGTAHAREFLSRLADARSAARIILVGEEVSAYDAFEYARLGVDAWLASASDARAVLARLEEVLRGPTALDRVAAAHLGRYGLKDAQHIVRRSMLTEALGRTKGNRHAAARLLRVDRRAVQLALKEIEAELDSSPPSDFDTPRIVPTMHPAPFALDELHDVVAQRVVKQAENVILWRELPVPSIESVKAVFGRLAALSASGPLNLVIDLEGSKYPSKEVRECLRQHFRALQSLSSITVHTGKNNLLGLAARVVLADAQRCSFSVSSHLESAVRSASIAPTRRAL